MWNWNINVYCLWCHNSEKALVKYLGLCMFLWHHWHCMMIFSLHWLSCVWEYGRLENESQNAFFLNSIIQVLQGGGVHCIFLTFCIYYLIYDDFCLFVCLFVFKKSVSCSNYSVALSDCLKSSTVQWTMLAEIKQIALL